MITIREKKVTALEGDSAVAECLIEAYPKGIQYWELEDGEHNDEM